MTAPTRVVVDTSALEAICKANSPEPVFEHLPLCTTDICFEELRRNRSTVSDYDRKRAIKKVFELQQSFDTPTRVPTGMEYRPYVEDQGESSIIQMLDSNTDATVRYILLFDSSAADEVLSVIDPDTVEVNTPARAFELVWQGEFISESDHHNALRQIADREGWKGEALVDGLPHTDYDDVF